MTCHACRRLSFARNRGAWICSANGHKVYAIPLGEADRICPAFTPKKAEDLPFSDPLPSRPTLEDHLL